MRRGVTLIELLVVIVIIGVLATIATVSYRKFQTQAHVTEANAMMQSIRLAQMQYFRDTGGQFLDTSVSSATDGFCPAGALSSTKRTWNGACPDAAPRGQWRQLALKVDGPVLFQYKAYAGPRSGLDDLNAAGGGADVATFNGVAQNFAGATSGPFFLIVAQADPHDSGAVTTRALTHSQARVVGIEENY